MNEHVIVISHRRSGTHLLIDLIINNFPKYNEYINLDRLIPCHEKYITLKEFKSIINKKPFVIKTHTHSNTKSFFQDCNNCDSFINTLFNKSKLIYVYRDGRDVLTSLYFFFNKLPKDLSFSNFIRMDNEFEHNTYNGKMNRIEYWLYHLEGWFSSSRDILFITYNEIMNNYEEVINRIEKHICAKKSKFVDVRRSQKIMIKSRKLNFYLQQIYKKFAKLIFKKKMTSVYFRKGQIGDYVNYFSKEDLQYYKELTDPFFRKYNLKF
ncbi:MAG: sulfotransferase domain-containing protein [Candidatus Helarchaeota archaeon]